MIKNYRELHIHLEGSLSKNLLFDLWQETNDAPSRADFESWFKYTCFDDFLNLWCKHQLLLFNKFNPRMIVTRLVRDFFEYLQRFNIEYAEVHISPIDSLFLKYKLPKLFIMSEEYNVLIRMWDKAVTAVSKEFEDKHKVKLIIDFVRNYPEDVATWQLQNFRSNHVHFENVIGVGLGGGSCTRRVGELSSIFYEIKNMGYHLFAHAGEHLPKDVAYQEVRDAIDLGVTRIGHGIHVVDNTELVSELIAKDIALEVCPSSNVFTNSVSSFEKHPLRKLYDLGIPIIISSDDPTYFDTDIQKEFKLLKTELHFTDAEILDLHQNSIKYSVTKSLDSF
ncbi:MAG: hypothetical protein KC646_04615 [Candidatus Cloacimonetes bacterium]|nr:hypothetical protein [Candidatus Cloacimonadota bacterium]